MAVPCWSSWKTGMSRRSRSLRSISKQRGARDVLEIDAAETRGDVLRRCSTISSTSRAARQIGKASTPASVCSRTALPSITGSAACGPMSPSPSTAEPSVTIATRLPLAVSSSTMAGSSRMTWAGDERRRRHVEHVQDVVIADRDLGADLEHAAVAPPQVDRLLAERLVLAAGGRLRAGASVPRRRSGASAR